MLIFIAIGCTPQEDEGITLGPQPDAPAFSWQVLEDDPNRVAIHMDAVDVFDFVWALPGGTPNSSTREFDTIFYATAGQYEITLHGSSTSGNGTSSKTEIVTIAQDATIECDENLDLLTDACSSKCWRISEAPGAIVVGPSPLSSEWFSSNGIEPTQADDRWCFVFDGAVWDYQNNGSSFSACQGYVEDPNYPVPTGVSFSLLPSDTEYSEYKIVLNSDDAWMGVEDSGPVYEIVSMTEEELVLLTATKPCDGAPSNGWFTLTFKSE